MTWASWPIAAWAAGIAIPSLLILYFLKLRRRDLEVSTTLLWKKSIQDLQANAPFQKLRRNILLLLQLLALAAAIAALGQPQMQAETGKGLRHVVLIDRSASMNSTDGDSNGASRLEIAKKQAIELVDSMPEPGLLADADSADQAMVIAFDVSATAVQAFTPSKAQLRAAINAIQPTDCPSSLQEALKLAKAYSPRVFMENKGFVSRGTPITLHLFSDGRIPDSARLGGNAEDVEASDLSPDDKVVYHAIGKADSPNLGITGLRAERAYDNPGKLTIFVGIQNASTEARTADVELSIDNKRLETRSVTIPAGSKPATPPAAATDGTATPAPAVDMQPRSGGLVFQMNRPEGGVAGVRLVQSTPDPLATDDIAYVIVPPARRLSVAVVTGGNLFLREAIEGMNLSRRAIITPEAFQKMVDGQRVENAGLSDFDVFVLDRWLPTLKGPDGKPREFLPPGRVLVLGAVPPPPMGLVDQGAGEPTIVVDWLRDHPALRYAGLGDLLISKSRKVAIAPESPVRALAHDQNGPAIVEAADNATRAIIVAFDPADSDWPLKPGFVLFLASAIQNLASDGAEALGDSLRPGQTLVQRLPLGAQDVRVALPDASTVPLVAAPDGRVAYGPIAHIGIYSISWSGPTQSTDVVVDSRGRRAAAVNLLEPAESVIATRTMLDLPGRVVAAKAGGDGQSLRSLWPWFILGALAVVMLEWFVYNRKVHV